MNFQQLKPQCCDVFIWVAVFRDEIVLWVMSSTEVQSNPFIQKDSIEVTKETRGSCTLNMTTFMCYPIMNLKMTT